MPHFSIAVNDSSQNNSNHTVLSDKEITALSSYLNNGLVKAGSLAPSQLTEVLRRIEMVGTINLWKLLESNELLDSGNLRLVDATTLNTNTHHAPSVAGGRNSLQPVGSETSLATQNDRLPFGLGDDTARSGAENTPTVVQTPGQSPLSSTIGASQLMTPPADSPRKRRRTKRSLDVSQTPTDGGITSLDAVILSLLGGYKFEYELKEKERKEALRRAARLICQDPGEVLRPRVQDWRHNASQGSHALGLPLEWRGVEAASNYIRIIRQDTPPDPITQRVARMLLVLNYEVICQNPQKYCSRPRHPKERRSQWAMDCITRASLNYPSGQISKGERDAVHSCFRQGRWLWTLAGTVGMGIVLLCDGEVMAAIKGINLINCEVAALAVCAFYTRPGTVGLLRSLEQMVIPLMFGDFPAPLEVALEVNGSGILGPSAMSDISKTDNDALLEQRVTNPWPQLDFESAASQKKAELLNNPRETKQSAAHPLSIELVANATSDSTPGAGTTDSFTLDPTIASFDFDELTRAGMDWTLYDHGVADSSKVSYTQLF